ncbi:MAG: phosphatase PAP2 family protein [Chlamydiae bacterium]|nr:phosphatase PAP2 family protein [Chlamydiota bacterium]
MPITSAQGIDLLRKFGDRAQWGIPIFSLGYAHGKGKTYESKMFLASVVIQQIAIDSIKYLTRVPRPNGKGLSFPSGHTTAAFFGAGFYLAVSQNEENQFTKTSIRATLFVLAALTGMSRYLSKKHWASDVAFGACMGTCFGYFAGTKS